MITTGSFNVPRKIPYTDRTISVHEAMADGFLKEPESGGGSIFLLATSIRADKPFTDGTYPDTITGAVLQRKRALLTFNSHASSGGEGIRLSGPEDLYFCREASDMRYARLLFALLDRNVTQIISTFTWMLLDVFRYLEKEYEALISDIEKGTLNGAPWMDHGEKELLRSYFRADPERARELREIFEGGFDEPVMSKIWPWEAASKS